MLLHFSRSRLFAWLLDNNSIHFSGNGSALIRISNCIIPEKKYGSCRSAIALRPLWKYKSGVDSIGCPLKYLFYYVIIQCLQLSKFKPSSLAENSFVTRAELNIFLYTVQSFYKTWYVVFYEN